MKKPLERTSQAGYVQSALRMPKPLRLSIQAEAEKNGRSMNAEILHRLETAPLEKLEQDVAELKTMVKDLLQIVREKL